MRIRRPSQPPAPRIESSGRKGGPKPKSGNVRAGRSTLTAKSAPAKGGVSIAKAGNTRGSRSTLGAKDLPVEVKLPNLGGERYGLGNVRGRRPDALRPQGIAGDHFQPRVGRRVDDRTSAFEVNGRPPASAGPARRETDGDGFASSPPGLPSDRRSGSGGNQLNSRGPITKKDFGGPMGTGGAA